MLFVYFPCHVLLVPKLLLMSDVVCYHCAKHVARRFKCIKKINGMRIACNIYKHYGVTQSYKHVTLASSCTHTYSIYTKAGRCLSLL